MGLEEEEDTSSDSFDEMLSYANDNLINDRLHVKKLYYEKFAFQMFLKNS